MSAYLRLLNEIKDRVDSDWLTDSQLDVLKGLEKLLNPPNFLMNVYGSAGVGKTVLGWVLAQDWGFQFQSARGLMT